MREGLAYFFGSSGSLESFFFRPPLRVVTPAVGVVGVVAAADVAA